MLAIHFRNRDSEFVNLGKIQVFIYYNKMSPDITRPSLPYLTPNHKMVQVGIVPLIQLRNLRFRIRGADILATNRVGKETQVCISPKSMS